jgi:hypothetical protein
VRDLLSHLYCLLPDGFFARGDIAQSPKVDSPMTDLCHYLAKNHAGNFFPVFYQLKSRLVHFGINNLAGAPFSLRRGRGLWPVVGFPHNSGVWMGDFTNRGSH